MANDRHGPVVLAILDGWGIAPPGPGNAIAAANTPVMDRLLTQYPNATLRASGEDVGLPDGQMGNSEVGHLNLGAGFVVYQWLTRINRAVREGTLFDNATLRAAMSDLPDGGHLHLVGLVSDGGVHSHISHLEALLEMAHRQGLRGSSVLVHAITDGRDTAPDSARGFLERVQRTIDRLGVGAIATVSGRYFAMDRDRRWDRTKKAYEAMVHGAAPEGSSAVGVVDASYRNDITDEFVEPRVLPVDGRRYGGMHDGDHVLWFNFRSDRGRQLVEAMVDQEFDDFDHGSRPALIVTTMTEYMAGLPVTVAYQEADIAHPLASEISRAGLTQLHAAETEKYPHVTYFLNGGREAPFEGETRRMVPSPRVATYDLQPEMSAGPLADLVINAVRTGGYGFIVVNFANSDMVGHTGDIAAVVRAVETVDACLGRLVDAVLSQGGVLLVTADHGNAEEMIDPATARPLTSHTTNVVPVILVANDDDPVRHASLRTDGVLSAVAPTVLDLLGLTPPSAMDQPSLIRRSSADDADPNTAPEL
jgi:2,3-bisphosphoglycerate-independent phosphoglycerate mutase